VTDHQAAASVFPAMHSDRVPVPAETEGHARGEMAGMDQGMRVLSYLIAGVLLYGGLGWLGDHVLGTGFLLPVGIVLGAAGGCYVIIRRYGRVPEIDQSTTTQKREGAR
jgi:F0F1-type ATP synthase assembly protein I